MFKFKIGDEVTLIGIDGLKEVVRGKIIYIKDECCYLVLLYRTDIGWVLNNALIVPKEIRNKYKWKKCWWITDMNNYGAKIVHNLLEIE